MEDAERYLISSYAGYQKIGETFGKSESATWLGQVYAEKKDYTNAEKYLNEAITIQRSIDSKKYLWQGLQLLAKVKFAQGDIGASIASLKEAVEIIEDFKGKLVGGADQVKFFAKGQEKIEIYESLISQLISQNDVTEAFYYQEKMNIEGLKEQTRNGGGGTRSVKVLGEEEDEVAEMELKIEGTYFQLMQEKAKPAGQRSEEKIQELERLMTIHQNRFDRYSDSLERANPSLFQEVFGKNINLEQLNNGRQNLPDDVVVVEYLVLKDQLIIFVASNKSIQAKSVELNSESLFQFVTGFYNQIADKDDINQITKSAQKLYDLFITPVYENIRNYKRLAIVPTGSLFVLPFHALGDSLTDGSFKYLIEEFEIFYINDVMLMNKNQAWNMENLEILAFGNGSKDLEYAEEEVLFIGKTFNSSTIYVQDEASEYRAKEKIGQYAIVHFATHGTLDPENFGTSYLSMSPGKNEDGKLEMDEIRDLEYRLNNCQLVVLSACNTLVNEKNDYGWINNPAKTFIKKGARSVVASLWAVDDRSTGLLMAHFYNQLHHKNSKSGALQQAQISMINNPAFAHPYYWSAFELIGEWK